MFAVVSVPGEHVLSIRSKAPPGQLVSLNVRLESPRAASRMDHLRAAASEAFGRGEHQLTADRWEEAIPEYRKALSLWETLRDSERRTATLYRLGLAHAARKEHDSALDFYRQVLDTLPEEEHLDRAITFDQIGRVQYGAFRFRESLESYSTALRLFHGIRYAPGEADVLANIALVLKYRGELQAARESYFSALDLQQKMQRVRAQAIVRHNLGELYLASGDAALALDSFNEEAVLQQKIEDRAGRAQAIAGKVAAAQELGRNDQALGWLDEIFEAERELQGSELEATVLIRIANLYTAEERLLEAEQLYRKALAAARAIDNTLAEAAALGGLGHVFDRKDEEEQAIELFNQALALFLRAGDVFAVTRVLHGRALAERDLGRTEAALGSIEKALGMIESLRPQTGAYEARSIYLASRRSFYDLYIDLLVARGLGEHAFDASERARSRSLLDEQADARSELRPAEFAQLRRVEALLETLKEKEIKRLERLSLHGALPAAGLDLNRQIRDIRGQLERARAALQKKNPQVLPLDLRQIQKGVLDRDNLLLSYFLGEHGAILWGVTSDSFHAWRLPCSKASIERLSRDAHRWLAGKDGLVDGEATLAELAGCVLPPPARALAQGRKLVVAADGALRLVPFAVLPVPHSLALDHEITYIPSASVLAASRERVSGRRSPAKTIVLLANPPLAPGSPYDPLPHAEHEARVIASLVPKGMYLLAVGDQASRELMLGPEPGRYRIVHIGAHGVLADVPDLSGLLLAGGLLRSYEIYDLDLPLDLAVLSACDTGREESAATGEGVSGMARAFLHAGSRRVVVSLWQVDDEATSRLMQEFYRNLLQRKLSAPAALGKPSVP